MTVRPPTPLTVYRAAALSGCAHVTGDEALSHLVVMLGGLSTGITRISGLARSDSVLRTLAAVEALGGLVRRDGARVDIYGRGAGGLRQPRGPVDCGGSLHSAYLSIGAIAGHDFSAEVTGGGPHAGLSMQPVLTPLRQMGLSVVGDRSNLPLVVRGSASLVPIAHRLPVASEPIKHAVLLAGLAATGETTVIEPSGTRGLGWRLMRHLGADVRVTADDRQLATTVSGDAELEGRDLAVPGDAVLAAALASAAAIVPGSDVMLEGVPADGEGLGFFSSLVQFGADVAWLNAREECGVAMADARVRHRSLRGADLTRSRVLNSAAELPLLVAVAAFASGQSRFEGLSGLPALDQHRVVELAKGLAHFGVGAKVDGDALIIPGSAAISGGVVFASISDPIVAIALVLMGLRAERPTAIDDGGAVAQRTPEFRSLLGTLGAQIEV